MGRTRKSSDTGDSSAGADTATIERVRVVVPKQYKVLLLNDNYTTMEFVMQVLETIFRRTPSEATQIMLKVHKQGRGLAGVYAKQIAEAKIESVHRRAGDAGYPLKCSMEVE